MIHHKFPFSYLLLNRIMKMQQNNTGRESFSWDPAIQTCSQLLPLIILNDACLCMNLADFYITEVWVCMKAALPFLHSLRLLSTVLRYA